MRRLSWLSWGLAVLLALVISWQQRQPEVSQRVTALVPAPELALWLPSRVAASVASPPQAVPLPPVMPQPAAIPAPVVAAKPAGCARLGIFPDADWASQVGQLLLPEAERKEGLGWVVRAYPGQRYYVVFTGLDVDALAQRLVARKALLRRRVTATAHPESCS